MAGGVQRGGEARPAMIRHLRHDRIDKSAWDAVLDRCEGPVWYARSAVLDAACPGWEALWDEERGALMPLTHHRKWGIPYLYQPFPLQQLGVYGPGHDAARIGEFLRAVPQRFRLADIYLTDPTVEGAGPGWRFTARQDQLVPLDRSIAAIRQGYSNNHLRSLRRAETAGLEIGPAMRPEAFLHFLTTAPQWPGWKVGVRQQASLQRLLELVDQRGEGGCLAVLHEGRAVAAGCFVHHGDRTIFLKGLALPEARPLNAMHLLIDRVLEMRAGRARWLDLAGSSDPALARFYAGFGAVTTLYLHALLRRFPVSLRGQPEQA